MFKPRRASWKEQVAAATRVLGGAISLSLLLVRAGAVVPCSSDSDCAQALHPLSTCVEGPGGGAENGGSFCSNPYASGCLRRILGDERFPAMRVCSSDDDAVEGGGGGGAGEWCSVPDFDYPEIRIAAGNWDSAVFWSFLHQIVLSELLGVPAVIETGSPDGRLSFYDLGSDYTYPSGVYYWDHLKALHNARDENGEPSADCDPILREGRPCAHFMPDVWNGEMRNWMDALEEGFIDQPEGTGMNGVQNLYMPKFAYLSDRSMITYFDLQRKENRRKIADTFRRPTTWYMYCEEISNTNCTEEDEFAKRVPTIEEMEEGTGSKYFVSGVYNGFFRKTEKNDCDANPDTCTGHVVNYPCMWSTYVEQQTYWNELPLESDGPLPPTNSYSYGDMIDIWTAANATESPVLMLIWSPDAHIQKWLGTPAEFVPVVLPAPTEECRNNRVSSDDRCSEDISARRGKKEGSCGYEAFVTQKILSSALREDTYSKDPADRSPAYEAIRSLRIDDLSIDAMLNSWVKGTRTEERRGFAAREAVCTWVANNIDYISATAIPRGYPRSLIKNGWYNSASGLLYSAAALAAVTVVFVLISSAITYKYRKKKVIRNAQISFLSIILFGCLLMATAAVVWVLEPTKESCVAKMWLIVLGYTLSLVPLLVKVYAINVITQGARKMKRKIIRRRNLLWAVALVVAALLLFLVAWTVADPPTRQSVLILSGEGGESVRQQVQCSSSSEVWHTVAMVWQYVLLICATALAFQARKVRSEFNESINLARLVYSHFFFAVFRSIAYFLCHSGGLAPSIASGIISLLLTCDVGFVMGIYFWPKFFHEEERSSAESHPQISLNNERPAAPVRRRIRRTISPRRLAMSYSRAMLGDVIANNDREDREDFVENEVNRSPAATQLSTVAET